MAWKTYGQSLMTADMIGDPTRYQVITPTRNRIVKAVRATLILYGNPVFSTAQMSIYAVTGDSLGDLLASSRPRSKTSMCSSNHGIKSFYFEFESMPSLRANASYALALNLSVYTGDDASHVAWAKEMNPFMVHDQSIESGFDVLEAPYSIEVIGDRF